MAIRLTVTEWHSIANAATDTIAREWRENGFAGRPPRVSPAMVRVVAGEINRLRYGDPEPEDHS